MFSFNLRDHPYTITSACFKPFLGPSTNLTHCPKLNMNEKKNEQVPIQLPNIARTLSDAKKIIKKNSFLGPPR